MSEVSVIMVSYHTGAPLWLAIESVLNEPECRELIVVNNGNIPGVEVILQKLAQIEPRFRLITGQGNVGFAKACNLGARAATGDMLLLLNPDCMLSSGNLAAALDVLRKFPENTLAGCFLQNPDGTEQRGCRRSLLTPRNAVMEGLGITGLFEPQGPLNITGPMPESAHEVPAISGAFMMLARTFYERIGGLDEGYFLHMEDLDFCVRVHKGGGKVICMPEVKVIHFRSTSEVSGAVVERHKTRSFIRYLKTHFSGTHSAITLSILSFGIWCRYYIKTFISRVDSVFVPPLVAKREIARAVLLYRFMRSGAKNDSLLGKTVIVTGGSGQTGLCVVGKALARGANVIAMYNRTIIPFSHPRLTWMQYDLTKPFPDIKGDVLIHTAALWQLPDRLAEIMAAGTSRVIAFGSTSMFAKMESKNAYEQDIVGKLKTSEERIFKIAAEKKGALTVLRPTMIYGVGLDANITRLADIIRRFGFIPVYREAKGLRQPVQAMDLADAALDIIENAITFGKSYNLGGGQTLSYTSMVTTIYQYLGKKPRTIRPPFFPEMLDWLGWVYQINHVNGEIARRMGQDLVFDMSEAIADFNYRPKGFLMGSVVI